MKKNLASLNSDRVPGHPNFYMRDYIYACFRPLSPLRLRVMTIFLLGVIICASCAPLEPPSPPVADRELTITAKFLANDKIVQCPPICMEVDNPPSGPDTTKPLSFEVCSAATQCFQLESGKSAKVSADATVKAPDGKSRGEQLAALEREVFLKFQKWADGPTAESRSVGFKGKQTDLTAYYAAWLPVKVPTTSSSRGCANDVEIFLGTGSQWAPVKDQPKFEVIEGPVTYAYVSDTDYPGNHNTNDHLMWVLLSGEEPYKMLSEKNGQFGSRPNQIQVEWEWGSYPTWAWPSPEAVDLDEPAIPKIDDADLVWIKGKWIFDCAHEEEGILQGAWTEIHPPIAVAVMRGTRKGKLFLRDDISKYVPELHRKATGIQGIQVDIWINGDGGEAVESVKCAKPWADGMGCIFTPTFDIRGVYEFDIPLPPPPTNLYPEAKFRLKMLRLQPGQPKPLITPSIITSGVKKLHLKLDLSNYSDTWRTCRMQNEVYGEKLVNCSGDAYGVTLIAGWELFDYPPDLRRVRLLTNSIKIYDDIEGENGDGEFKLWLDVGPGANKAGDPLKPLSVALHGINPGLNDAAGDGESYALIQNGSTLSYVFNIRENSSESNKLRLFLHGYEDDPIWDDELGNLLRVLYLNKTIWEPDNGYPEWARWPPSNCMALTAPNCFYGKETQWGTARDKTSPPIPYDDHIWGDCDPPCFSHSLDYVIEELSLP